MSKTKGFAFAAKQSREELDANALQVFLKSPRGGKPKPLDPEDCKQYKANCKEFDIKFLIGHASYLVNLAKPQAADGYGIESLREDLEKLGALGGHGLVYHIGKHLDQDYEVALGHLLTNLKVLLKKIKPYGVPLLLENASGQGTEMGLKMEEIARILDEMGRPDLLKVCIDTCHAFAAGYNLADPKEVDKFFKEMDATIGLDNVICFHLNDSKFGCGERKDRHENLGKGKIGKAGLLRVAELAIKHKIPMVLETPLIDKSHKKDLDTLRRWLK